MLFMLTKLINHYDEIICKLINVKKKFPSPEIQFENVLLRGKLVERLDPLF